MWVESGGEERERETDKRRILLRPFGPMRNARMASINGDRPMRNGTWEEIVASADKSSVQLGIVFTHDGNPTIPLRAAPLRIIDFGFYLFKLLLAAADADILLRVSLSLF